jgi:hypothetical protein
MAISWNLQSETPVGVIDEERLKVADEIAASKRGFAPVPYAPIMLGPLLVTAIDVETANVSPRLKRRRTLPVPMLEAMDASASLLVTWTAPDGHPVKVPEVEIQIVLVPAHCVSGSVTVIVFVTEEVFVPSKALVVTV